MCAYLILSLQSLLWFQALAGPEPALLLQEQATLNKAKQNETSGKLVAAEKDYLRARLIARQLPPEAYHVETDILRDLANLYAKEKNFDNAERAYKERLTLLTAKQKDVDLDVGIALFDLQSFYGATGRWPDAEKMTKQAMQFYEQCKVDPKLAKTCDRRLADVQAFAGVYLFEHHQYTEAEPYLRIVAARADNEVRPMMLEASLIGLAAICFQDGREEESKMIASRAWELRSKYPEAAQVTWPRPTQ